MLLFSQKNISPNPSKATHLASGNISNHETPRMTPPEKQDNREINNEARVLNCSERFVHLRYKKSGISPANIEMINISAISMSLRARSCIFVGEANWQEIRMSEKVGG
jgi:hypothetical protein